MKTVGAQDGLRSWKHRGRVGPKKALKSQEVWAIRFELQHRGAFRDKCLFDIAIDSKLRGCDLVKLRIDGIASGGVVRHRAMVIQQKTGHAVQFELTETTRESTAA